MLIRNLLPHERPLFAEHLKRLSPEDRRFRFAQARVTDQWIDTYVDGIAAGDMVLASFDEARLTGAVHVAIAGEMAELGLSVDAPQRTSGIGAELLRRAVRWARNRRVERVYTLCQSDNAAMMNLAQRLGMTIHRESGTAEAFLPLDPPDLLSVSDEYTVTLNAMLHDLGAMVRSCPILLPWGVR